MPLASLATASLGRFFGYAKTATSLSPALEPPYRERGVAYGSKESRFPSFAFDSGPEIQVMGKPSRVLVTGASGFIGRSLCPCLEGAGFTVRGTVRHPDRQVAGAASEWIATGPLEGFEDWASAVDGVGAVVHTAATSDFHGPATTAALTHMDRINVDSTARLARASAAAGVTRFIFLSSIKVNGLITTGRPFSAEDEPRPAEPYGRSKLAAEAALREIAAETDLELVILRPGLVYGPNPRGSVLQLMRAVDRGIPLPLAGVDNRRSLLAVQNLCDLIRVCLEHPGAAGKVFLVSDGADISTPELIRRLARLMGRPTRLFTLPLSMLRLLAALVRRQPQVQALTMSQQLDSIEVRERLGWKPPMSFEEALQLAVTDYLQSTEAGAAGGNSG